MFTEKQEGVKTRPKRRRIHDNPYDIYVVKKVNGEMGYLVHFRNGTYKDKWININGTLYAMLDQFEREDLRYLNELERHRIKQEENLDVLNCYYDVDEKTVEEVGIRNIRWEMVNKLMNRLSKKQRRRIMLHYIYDMEYKEIAMIENCNIAAAQRSVVSGLKKIRGWMNEDSGV